MPHKKKGKREAPPTRKQKWMTWLLALFVSFLALLAIAYFMGARVIKNEGAQTPEELVTQFVHVLEDKNDTKLAYCFYHVDRTQETTRRALSDHIKAETGIMSIDYDNVDISFIDIVDTDAENIVQSLGFKPEEIKLGYVRIPMMRKHETGTYELMANYFATVYKAENKWFLFDATKDVVNVLSGVDDEGNQIDITDAYRYFNNTFVGGNSLIGFMPLDDTWYIYQPEVKSSFDGVQILDQIHYQQESGNAAIHLMLLNSEKSAADLANQLAVNLSDDKNAAVSVKTFNDTVADCDAIRLEFYSEDMDLYFVAYLVNTVNYDGNVRYLSLECTQDYLEAYRYLAALILPDKVGTETPTLSTEE